MQPLRETWWNVLSWEHWLVYALACFAGGAVVCRIGRLARVWRRGARPPDGLSAAEALRRLWSNAVLQVWIADDIYAGIMHLAIFWGFLTLFAGTIANSLDHYTYLLTGFKLLKGGIYLGYKLVLDMAGLALLAGVIMAAHRRYVRRPPYLGTGWRFGVTLALLFMTGLTGLLLEGLRLRATLPDWGVWSPAGNVLSLLLGALGVSSASAEAGHRGMWLVHLVVAMATVAGISTLNLLHMITSPLHVLQSGQGRKGELSWVDRIDEAARVGASRVTDLTQPQMLSLDACTECGRCENSCPAFQAGQALSPKQVVLALRSQQRAAGSELPDAVLRTASDGLVCPAALWACTTCRSCAEVCPVLIDPMSLIIDLRRGEVDGGRVPSTVARVLEDCAGLRSVWGQAENDRASWIEELGLPAAKPGDRPELLYLLGDTAPYDLQAQSAARTLVKILNAAHVRPSSFGSADGSDGDFARRLGEEGLFQALAGANVRRLRDVGPKRILTHCPHTFNSLRNEYGRLGASFEVVHHSQLLLELLENGVLHPTRALSVRVAYHDPCYLGRYNGVYEEPRRVLQSLPGLELVEMPRHREHSLCCGGGGGMMFLDVAQGRRISDLRIEEAAALGVDAIATACPYCAIMLKDATATLAAPLQVKDLAEFVLDACQEAR